MCIYRLVASAVKEEDAASEDAVDDGEDEEEAEVLFELSKRSEATKDKIYRYCAKKLDNFANDNKYFLSFMRLSSFLEQRPSKLRPDNEGDEAEADADDQGALHVLGRPLLDHVLVWLKLDKQFKIYQHKWK